MTSAGLQFVEMELEDQIALLQFLIEDEEETEVAPAAEAPSETVEANTATEGTGEEGEKLS